MGLSNNSGQLRSDVQRGKRQGQEECERAVTMMDTVSVPEHGARKGTFYTVFCSTGCCIDSDLDGEEPEEGTVNIWG